jgi:type IV pilus assembly protein PilW
MRARHAISRFRQAGLSLVELMVALLVSSFLLIGLVQIFGTTKAAFITTDALSRVQENARFALEFMRRDARMVGHMGCVNEISHFLSSPPTFSSHLITPATAFGNASFPFRFDVPIQGFEYTGTARNDNYTIPSATPAAVADVTQWNPVVPAGATGLAPSLIGRAVPGSDILVLRFFSEDSVPLATPFTNHAAQQVSVNTGRLPAGFVESGGIYAVADCDHASLFQATSALVGATFAAALETPAAPQDGDNARNWATDQQFGTGATLHRGESMVYFVGVNAAGQPALFRLRLAASSADAAAYVPEELVEGVENMQIFYGVDTTTSRDDAVDQYANANQVNLLDPDGAGPLAAPAWARVISLRISLLIRSPDQANSTLNTARDLGGVNVTPQTDGRLRQIYETDVALRNRLRGA